ncbi:c-type cytochrome [Leptothrix discophora]|uniref:C-type cytochrome n=1 Tax=Leptothrix discophora TaxID=89 RepID=A0ABT9G5V2_LEPDI|nr:c-type cytochrome [Leptothrix discophora]MDP4301563.1 c-type cytochrome [Leptothrix discophora]
MKKLHSAHAVLRAVTFATLTLVGGVSTVQAQEVKGDVAAGKTKAAMCIGCHGIPGYRASFPEVYQVPMISGQGAGYIVSSLTAYQKGDRKHPTMRGIAGSLTDQDKADLAAYYASHGEGVTAAPAAQPTGPVAELLTKGACAGCHGDSYSKPADPASIPKLGGQPADYLYVALRAYKIEGNQNVGRANAIMGGQVKQFTDAELKAIAKYIASLPSELSIKQNAKFR